MANIFARWQSGWGGHKDIHGGGGGSTRPGGLGGRDNRGHSGCTASGGGEVERHKLASAAALKHNNQLKHNTLNYRLNK
jgi:hypothetical protein